MRHSFLAEPPTSLPPEDAGACAQRPVHFECRRIGIYFGGTISRLLTISGLPIFHFLRNAQLQ
jgi:hypothetical protein